MSRDGSAGDGMSELKSILDPWGGMRGMGTLFYESLVRYGRLNRAR